jgi:hypothetical protein
MGIETRAEGMPEFSDAGDDGVCKVQGEDLLDRSRGSFADLGPRSKPLASGPSYAEGPQEFDREAGNSAGIAENLRHPGGDSQSAAG